MTIAACYFSSEGVVLGADSTSTNTTTITPTGGNPISFTGHFNHAQKVFEIGERGTLGVNLWGNAKIGSISHRRFIAEVSDELSHTNISSVLDAANLLCARFWSIFKVEYATQIMRFNFLRGLSNPTPDEEKELIAIEQGLSGGYCLGGTWHTDRQPRAFEITYGPSLLAPPVPKPLNIGVSFWGCPAFVGRLLYGIDNEVYSKILQSGRWSGTVAELDSIIRDAVLFQHFDMPLREAIDFIDAIIYTTIKAFKFSQMPAVCGGPIDIAVIAADRRFRWVKHKSLDHAIT